MAKKQVRYQNLEIEIDGRKYTGEVEIVGTKQLLPTIWYGAKYKVGNLYPSNNMVSMINYCEVLLRDIVLEEEAKKR